MADAAASFLCSRRVAREHNDARSFLCEKPGQRLADAHGSAGNDDDFVRELHDRVVVGVARQVKLRAVPA